MLIDGLGKLTFAAVLGVALLGCNDRQAATAPKHIFSGAVVGQGPSCGPEDARVIEAALDGSGLRKILVALTSKSHEKTVVILGGIRPFSSGCPEADGIYSMYIPSQAPHQMPKSYVTVSSMFRSGDSAYVRLEIFPTAISGEFFLLKKSEQWIVVDSVIWEE